MFKGTLTGFGPYRDSFIAWAGDEHGTAIEVYPVGTEMFPDRGMGQANFRHAEGASPHVATHAAVSVELSTVEVLEVARRRRLIPAGPAQWPVRRAEALADGLLDMAGGITVEMRRPPSEQSPADIERRRRACVNATVEMGRSLASLPARLTLGHIAIACACGYLDFRPTSIGSPWRHANPALADWYAGFESRPSLVQTRPDDGSYRRFAPAH